MYTINNHFCHAELCIVFQKEFLLLQKYYIFIVEILKNLSLVTVVSSVSQPFTVCLNLICLFVFSLYSKPICFPRYKYKLNYI